MRSSHPVLQRPAHLNVMVGINLQHIQQAPNSAGTIITPAKVNDHCRTSGMGVSNIFLPEFLIQSLDMPSDAKAPAGQIHEFSIPAGGMIGVYNPANIKGPDLNPTLTLIRQNLQIQKAYLKTMPAALVYR